MPQEPQVLSTTTSATPIADSISPPTTGPIDVPETAEQSAAADGEPEAPAQSGAHVADQESPANYTTDVDAISNAHGNPDVWAHELYQLIGSITGKYIDEQSLAEWLNSFAIQVASETHRSVFFSIANSIVPSDVKGDPALQLLQFRDDLARGFRHQAGL